jgi:NADH:ubiquinone oxidoreductase subunit K
MGTDAFPYLLESLRVAALSIHSFIALVCFVIAAIGIFGLRKTRQTPVTVLGSVAMMLVAIVFLAFSVTKGFSEPRAIYYAGTPKVAGTEAVPAQFHVGVFRKVGGDVWEEVPLKDDLYYKYTFRFEKRVDSRFYLIDDERGLRIEINTEDRRIFLSRVDTNERKPLYNVIAVI